MTEAANGPGSACLARARCRVASGRGRHQRLSGVEIVQEVREQGSLGFAFATGQGIWSCCQQGLRLPAKFLDMAVRVVENDGFSEEKESRCPARGAAFCEGRPQVGTAVEEDFSQTLIVTKHLTTSRPVIREEDRDIEVAAGSGLASCSGSAQHRADRLWIPRSNKSAGFTNVFDCLLDAVNLVFCMGLRLGSHVWHRSRSGWDFVQLSVRGCLRVSCQVSWWLRLARRLGPGWWRAGRTRCRSRGCCRRR